MNMENVVKTSVDAESNKVVEQSAVPSPTTETSQVSNAQATTTDDKIDTIIKQRLAKQFEEMKKYKDDYAKILKELEDTKLELQITKSVNNFNAVSSSPNVVSDSSSTTASKSDSNVKELPSQYY